jgi:hypothetical protein
MLRLNTILNMGQIYSKLARKRLEKAQIKSETQSDETKRDDGSHDRGMTL